MADSAAQTRLEDLVRGVRVRGVATGEVTVESVRWHGTNAVTVAFRDAAGHLDEAVLYRDDEPALRLASTGPVAGFDADAEEFKLAAEALRIRMAGRFDPMLAVTTSLVEPLPHQLQAVYGELLDRTPLRFLIADDPGAGKTIMAGLFIKELLLRGDLARCLVVAPGSLVEQWQDELWEKFGLRFDILTRSMIETSVDGRAFAEHPLLIARMDQLSRSDELLAQLDDTDWDLVVVDEAHRMSAHYFGQELKTTKRYQLGLLLGRIARHLLLLTATPHAGKEEDFQLFMALLDPDRFEGRFRDGVHAMDVDGLMRRMVKEELLTFEGKPLFPKRRAQTVPYELSDLEQGLYEAVTQYVREEMNRADQLKAAGEGRRSNTVGFALTVLQRRLASSPEAIWKSLERRRQRLERRRQELARQSDDEALASRMDGLLGRSETRVAASLDDDLEDLDAAELEELEEDVVDAATAARTAGELEVEIGILRDLEELARRVRFAGTDRKWNELRALLLDDRTVRDGSGNLRKIIIFTEHRDTLRYLTTQIRQLLGRPEAVVEIHGGIRREDRRKTREAFTQDPQVQVLVATDAAGEGLNLQRAHLMVNYDLPWNPNRIEQRFGRIHRIGQTEMCHLWNLVAISTREGQVYARLLEKMEEQRRSFGEDKVFDVLGEAFNEIPLRELLMEAIRYGEQPEVRARLDQVIDASVGEGIDKLIAERALATDTMNSADLAEIRLAMETARARRLQPHYIRAFFVEAFHQLGGRIVTREPGRFEITHVPTSIQYRDLAIPTRAPILARYQRITFEREHVDHAGQPKADLLAPGHPLLDAVVDVVQRHGAALNQGTVLVDASDDGSEPRLLVAIAQEVADGHDPPRTVSKRFDFVEIAPDGSASPCGPAPYLDYDPVDPGRQSEVDRAIAQSWLSEGPQDVATNWAITHGSAAHRAEIAIRVGAQVAKARDQVHRRLTDEINYWDARALDLSDQEHMGRTPRISAATASARARGLEARLAARMTDLDEQEALSVRPPVCAGYALVLPAGHAGESDSARPVRDTKAVERRAIEAILAAEQALGRTPREMPFTNPGFDILSQADDGAVVTIEVKGRLAGAEDVTITKNEVLIGKNRGTDHRLALVAVHPDRPHLDRLVYLIDPFGRTPDPGFSVTRLVFDWHRLWEQGSLPS